MTFWLLGFWLLLTVYWILTVALWWSGYAAVRPLRRVSDPPDGTLLPGDEPPQVTVILAARDEASRIEATVRHLFRQIGVRIELIAVDDRSEDATGETLQRLAGEFPDLRVRAIRNVPEGWIAKSHACAIAAAEASGEWLLFTDADTWMAPDTIARALQYVQSRDASHLALTPHSETSAAFGRASLLYFLTHGIGIGGLVQRGVPGPYFGIGAFNLIRRDLYRGFGGHESFRYELLDDLALGRAARRAGGRTVVADGMRLLQVSWAEGPLGLIDATEKNFVAVCDYSRLRALIYAGFLSAVSLGSLTAPLFADAAGSYRDFGWVPFAAWLASWIPYRIAAGRVGWGTVPALLAPMGFVTMAAAILHSTFNTLRHGGVRWRDTFYPIESLREFRRQTGSRKSRASSTP